MIELNPNFEILSQMRNLQITFLNDDGQCAQAVCELQTMTEVRALSLTTFVPSRFQELLPAAFNGPYDWINRLIPRSIGPGYPFFFFGRLFCVPLLAFDFSFFFPFSSFHTLFIFPTDLHGGVFRSGITV